MACALNNTSKEAVVTLSCVSLARLNYTSQNSLPCIFRIGWAPREILQRFGGGGEAVICSSCYPQHPLASAARCPCSPPESCQAGAFGDTASVTRPTAPRTHEQEPACTSPDAARASVSPRPCSSHRTPPFPTAPLLSPPHPSFPHTPCA
jgi:hypothetical protein